MLSVFLGQVLHKTLWTDTDPARKQALQVVLTHMQSTCQFSQARLIQLVFIQVADRLPDLPFRIRRAVCHLSAVDVRRAGPVVDVAVKRQVAHQIVLDVRPGATVDKGRGGAQDADQKGHHG